MYLDTSVVIAYSCPEALSRAAERVIRRDPAPAISDLVEVEFFSAVARKVRAREMSASDAARSGGHFAAHLQDGLDARVAIQRRHYETARDWLARHGAKASCARCPSSRGGERRGAASRHVRPRRAPVGPSA